MSPDESLVPIYDSLVSEVEFLVGRDVVEVRLEPAGGARIVFEVGDKPAPALYADVGPSTYEDESGSPHPLSEMVGAIVSNTSTEDGTLLLAFADGRRLRCEPHPRYEAWEVVGGTPQYPVVCSPGGELAVWDSTHVPSAAEAQEITDSLNEITGWGSRVREVTETGEILVEPGSEDESRQ